MTRTPVGTVLRVPASPSQRRLWAIEQTTAGEPLHNLNMELFFAEPVDPDVLRAAVADVIARHETLRTRFEVVDGVPHQCVLAPETPLAVPFTDLTRLPADEAAARYTRERDELAARTFDLATAPLLRVGHVRLADHTAVVVVVHHIVVDAWSCQIVITDLHRAVTARAVGRAPEWEPVPVQFADYTSWRATQADSPAARADLAYWREQLADVAVLDLTLGRPYPAEPSYRGGEFAVDLDERVTSGLDRLAAGARATRFAVLVAAWAAALGRVFGGQDVPIGTSVANRDLPDIARTAGFFVDRLVLRLSLAGTPTFRELVRRTRDVVLSAYEHNSVGFDQVVEAVAPPRRFGVAPLAQASINLQPRMGSVTDGPRTRLGGGQFGNGTSRHDIGLDLADFGDTIGGVCQYRYDVVPADAARRAHALFLDVLVRCATDPAAADLPAGELTALPADEVARLHADQDGGPLVRPQPASFRAMVDEWVRATPNAVAVSAADRDLTYARLTDLADRLATRLAAAGVRPGATVLVGLPRRAVLPVALLGVQAAGAIPVAVDLSAPPDHLATVAATAGARTAVVAPGTTFPADVTTVPVDIDELTTVDRAEPVRDPVAYVLFTSGTTGRPKGVVVEQRQLVAYTTGVLGLLEPPPGAVHLLVQAPTFDSSWTTVAGALASGGVLRLVDEDVARDPAELAARLAGSPVDYLKITPSHLAALLTGVPAETLRPRRALVLGGERERMAAVDRLRGLGWRVLGHYGPTETTVGVLAHELPATTESATVPLGRPLPGVRVYVLDDDLRPVPPGCRGELYVGGALVTRGYLGAPGLTAAAYLPDPFAPEPGARMYRTGDVVRRLSDGTFEFAGRRDRQVKVRGNRLELSGVEAVLAGLPAVGRAAAVVRDGRLVAYVVPVAGTDPTPEDLTAAAAGLLPAFAVPSAVVLLPELPMNASGKLDVAALPEPAAPEPAAAVPLTDGERRLVDVWRAVLATDDVAVTARFFEIGGDSIRAIELVGAARDRGIPLSGRMLFDQQTIRAIARNLAEQHGWPGVDPSIVVWLPGSPDVGDLVAGPLGSGVRVTVPVSRLGFLARILVDPAAEPPERACEVAPIPPDTAVDAAGLPFAQLVATAAEDRPPADVRVIDSACRVLDPGGVVTVTRTEVVGPGAERLRDRLVELVARRSASEPAYSAADFPDSGLDDAGLARLLDRFA